MDTPNVYHEIEWTVDNRIPNPCSTYPHWDEEYQVCMKGKLPRAMVGWLQTQFIFDNDFTLKRFQKEEESKKGSQYKAACQGDSGSGYWVTVHDETFSKSKTNVDDNTRRALVAVFTNTSPDQYKHHGKSGVAICGSNLKSSTGEKIIQRAISEVTTHEERLTFIKKWL